MRKINITTAFLLLSGVSLLATPSSTELTLIPSESSTDATLPYSLSIPHFNVPVTTTVTPTATATPTPYQAPTTITLDSNDVNDINSNETPQSKYEVSFSKDILKEIIDEESLQTVQAKEFILDNGVKSQSKIEIPKENNKNKNIKSTIEVTDESENTQVTTLETEDEVKITLNDNGGFTSKVENSEINAEVNVNANSEGNIKIIVQKIVQVDLKTPTGSQIRQDNSGRVVSSSEVSANIGESNVKDIKVEMSAEITGNLITTAKITNNKQILTYKLELPKKIDSGEMRLIKNSKSTSSNNIYDGIKSIFQTSNNFKIIDKSKRAVIEGENIEIVGSSNWQKFEENQYFDGKRTIILRLGSANVIKDGIQEELIKDVEYELPPSINSDTQTFLSAIYTENTNSKYLHLFKGWSLISSPINSELNISNTFKTKDIAYKFKNNSWIKNPEILKPNEGMWINYDFNIYVHFDKNNNINNSYEFNSTNLNRGWNLVGSGADISLNSNDYANIWAYDNITKEWVNNPYQILRGYGFWINY